MKKAMKKLGTLFLAAFMLCAMVIPSLPSMASEELPPMHTITINNEKEGHRYGAVQVFEGKMAADGQLTEIKWGDNMDSVELLKRLKADDTIGRYYQDCTTAASVAAVLAKQKDDSAHMQAFAKIAGNEDVITGPISESMYENKQYTIKHLPDGYYLIKDLSEVSGDDAATRFILALTKDQTITPKSDVPSIDKKIEGKDKDTDKNEVSLGDELTFKITGKVPDMTGYEKYFYILQDTMTAGLTWVGVESVKVGDFTLAEADKGDNTYSLKVEKPTEDDLKNPETAVTKIKLVINNFINYPKDAVVEIRYKAKVNEYSVMKDANENTVKLQFSNDPNKSYTGENEPGPGEPPIGETPEKKTESYLTGITIKKTDEDNNPLQGAKFTLTGESTLMAITQSVDFVESENGTYWALKNGTYTETSPETSEKPDDYVGDGKKYEKVERKTVKGAGQEEVDISGWVLEDGKLAFHNLGAGTYTLTETVAPDGYNPIQPITFKITFNDATQEFNVEDLVGATLKDDGAFEVQIKNQSGSKLPSTGGMGTTIFYAVGSLLAVGAAVLLVTKKRMEKDPQK